MNNLSLNTSKDRGQVASLKGFEHNAYTELGYCDSEVHAESQAYPME